MNAKRGKIITQKWERDPEKQQIIINTHLVFVLPL